MVRRNFSFQSEWSTGTTGQAVRKWIFSSGTRHCDGVTDRFLGCITCEHDIVVLMLTFSSKHNCVSGQRKTVVSMVAVSYCCFCGKEKKDKLCPEYKRLAAHPFVPVLSLLSFLTASLLSCSSSPTQNSWLMRQIKTWTEREVVAL